MKKGILFLLVVVSVSTNAQQTLKDALYGGKLKTDSGTVLRKGDDLSSKIDTSTKKPVAAEKNKPAPIVKDSAGKIMPAPVDSTATGAPIIKDNSTVTRDNNKIWKEFMDSAISTLKEEVMNSKKLKKGDYFIMLDYVIELDGKVTINAVYPSPESSYLAIEIKERLSISAPQLNPILGSNGKPRKLTKRYNFTLTKN
jgi:hypothetical protein